MLTNTYLALLGLPGGSEIIIIGIIALLLFGSRLPKVARSMGKSIVEFKKGIKNVQEDIDDASDDPAPLLTMTIAKNLLLHLRRAVRGIATRAI